MLRRWWVEKYHLPPTSDEFQRYTWDELWIEFYEDYYHKHPNELVELESDEDVQFVTDDPEIDKVEKMIADGVAPEEIQKVVDSWATDEKHVTTESDKTARLENLYEAEIGDGFEDESPTWSR